MCLLNYVSSDGAVGIVTFYRLDVPLTESGGGGGGFFTPVQTGNGVHPPCYRMGTGSFSGVKPPGLGFDRLKLRIHPPPSGPSWPVLG